MQNHQQHHSSGGKVKMNGFDCSVPQKSRIRVAAELKNLGAVHRLILDHPLIPERLRKKLCLAAEEVFVNICDYAYGAETGEAELSIEVSDGIRLTFCDEGKPFDPRENVPGADGYDVDTQIGGLGRVIAFGFADKIDYEYSGHKNRLTIIKYLEEEQA